MADGRRPRIGVFLSGGGSNLQALIDASKCGILSGEIALVVSNLRKAFGLERARQVQIPVFVYKEADYATPEEGQAALLRVLKEHGVEWIALAGYLKLLPGNILRAYPRRVVNIHPALLPKYGGKGMYGHFVHEAVLAAGEKESGLTIHLVDEAYDHGAVLHQQRVPILPGDTPETLAARVLEQEHRWYARVLDKLIRGEYGG
ncbi:MAG TPA: phosphoribosylglycinamide formyltransferase [candidate division Zixibacteria bacterium]|nr:phosphoribosylglycinamide formyltransferase [candidate division Zixibacteria bacterium]MDD4918149.1 phosphoribosylglycinamide formyltransferase [candidate division Zixibacteria bacterium]MDM7973275.1 phosphoribosylglycinamide formyltransferase [candidate division Zixibacteria bacterium]HOD66799.1 phosphoribosylglycinamide formyltransferase [candidate division Zixibacteria bacterium]HOZ07410.1 phosphoribosylglycinamide formyltransferase [candidate division Zixibacteria bacterium]